MKNAATYTIISCALVVFLTAGCSIFPITVVTQTEHTRCVEECNKKYGKPKMAYQEAICKNRCDRELGWTAGPDSSIPPLESFGKKSD